MRRLAHILALGTCMFGPVAQDMSNRAQAAPAAEEPAPLSRTVLRRLELWQKPGDGELHARYRLTRRSSLLYEPLTVHGALQFTPPDRLELRDDEATGATTTLTAAALAISANDASLPGPPPGRGDGARRWLRDRLLALVGAQDIEALRADSRIRVLRGGTIELSPPPGHPAQRAIRELKVVLVPATGEVAQLEISEASGDVVTLWLTEQRR